MSQNSINYHFPCFVRLLNPLIKGKRKKTSGYLCSALDSVKRASTFQRDHKSSCLIVYCLSSATRLFTATDCLMLFICRPTLCPQCCLSRMLLINGIIYCCVYLHEMTQTIIVVSGVSRIHSPHIKSTPSTKSGQVARLLEEHNL